MDSPSTRYCRTSGVGCLLGMTSARTLMPPTLVGALVSLREAVAQLTTGAPMPPLPTSPTPTSAPMSEPGPDHERGLPSTERRR